jgi:hypothetical protein
MTFSGCYQFTGLLHYVICKFPFYTRNCIIVQHYNNLFNIPAMLSACEITCTVEMVGLVASGACHEVTYKVQAQTPKLLCAEKAKTAAYTSMQTIGLGSRCLPVVDSRESPGNTNQSVGESTAQQGTFRWIQKYGTVALGPRCFLVPDDELIIHEVEAQIPSLPCTWNSAIIMADIYRPSFELFFQKATHSRRQSLEGPCTMPIF